QNQQYFRWDLSRVREELEKTMTRAFDRTWTLAEEKRVSLRTASFLVGIGRVGRATVLGGI
ncbi:MAG: glutamate dehydrogenase, partial [Planctomycetaceae bacterium]|nr:glutamate dehydrogenase [Planctomycetaceae bacterium]